MNSYNHSSQPSNRAADSKRIDTGDSALLELHGTNKGQQKIELGAETPHAQLTANLDHILVQASPSVQSGLESSIHMENKLPHSRLRHGNTINSVNNEEYSFIRSSADHTATVNDSLDNDEFMRQQSRIVTNQFNFEV